MKEAWMKDILEAIDEAENSDYELEDLFTDLEDDLIFE